MCTSVFLGTEKGFFGRNMDLYYDVSSSVIITPRKFSFDFRFEDTINEHFSIIGMGMVKDGYPLYFDGANEKGLCMAGLNFPGNACYSESIVGGKSNIASFELIPWVLSKCESIDEAKALLLTTSVIKINFNDRIPSSPLHWHIADADGSFVFEVTREGQRIYDDPVSVMTNNPPFDFHLLNLSQYQNLRVGNTENQLFHRGLKPFSDGMGSFGLPGDFSSASRFVKVAYLTVNSKGEDIDQFFHILDSVAVVRGSVLTETDQCVITKYSCGIDMKSLIYYYKTYENNRLNAVSLKNCNLDGEKLFVYKINNTQDIFFVN